MVLYFAPLMEKVLSSVGMMVFVFRPSMDVTPLPGGDGIVDGQRAVSVLYLCR